MPLPENFNEWEHLQDTVRRWHNKAVNQYFNKTPADSLETPKSSLRVACTMKDGDTATMTMMRMWLFEVTAGRLQSVQAPIYGIPVQELQRDVTFKPQIKLFFKERSDADMTDRNSPARGEITFRLMNETSATISRAKAEVLASAIKREFTNPIFVWEKGWYKYTYQDVERGYDLRLLVKSKTEGVRVTKKILDIQGHPFSDDNQQYIEHDRSYSLNPGTHLVYGSTIKKPVQRPRVDVSFRYAQLLIHGRANAINLVAMADVGLKSVIQRIGGS
ncbi:hypothetical protein VF14_26865 [Nostoc linckia z18]|uniref:Uncharacterized protein n=2 Tax=Nostoc linckia TaxID=92942 RepID=A0A9Q5Z953_NOSLI|nr:hypothetical protein [Nostoc linckia]PHK38796.1 hypothetical protein VF12_16870 [Nostoc linckia z15]PHK44314.1 hypothetical protein VF13_22550 [Nostoc linckia z16]PHJ62794.1 hypothetical protein VF02_16730 [Nostoc linckia z1]PHJ66624.1 hypothetical protein VF05_19005 [Nostoc linckia z3]PHJ72745.1 hypothetical protein VF03_18105 [Nostoc linckia z2]